MSNDNYSKNGSLSVRQLLTEDKYIIPFYQRNYAWGESEVSQLLADIRDMVKSSKKYYIGTLVAAKYKKQEDCFEVVDGQQRHTTLSIIYAVLSQIIEKEKAIKRNLYFEARPQNEILLKQMLDGSSSEDLANTYGSNNFLTAMQTVERFFENFEENDVESYYNFFSEEVIIFRVLLPEDTDLNHYFEIMNNRGEQLEKHEILKAALSSKIKHEQDLDKQKRQRLTFAKVWDACSLMDSHVQMNFSSDERRKLFGETLTETPTFKNLETVNLVKEIKVQNSENVTTETTISTLQDIVKKHELKDFNQEVKRSKIEKFTSIIDFPNFLLQVLKVTEMKENTSLDDKKLLDDFNYSGELLNPMKFIHQLLRYRILFDRYVIKHETDDTNWNWTLLKVERKVETKKESASISFPVSINDENKKTRHKLIMLQSMFHVTFTGNTNKKWLANYLKELDNNLNRTNPVELLKILENQAKLYYTENIKSRINLFNDGLRTPRFLFNYTDYLLWDLYYEKARGETVIEAQSGPYINSLLEKITEIKTKFYSFKFVQRSSIEHLFPQSRINELNLNQKEEEEKKDPKAIMNCFGNLCLISRSSNSSFSNHLPLQKKNDAKGQNESLKQQVMFASFNEDKEDKPHPWQVAEIEEHQKEIIALIESKTKNQ